MLRLENINWKTPDGVGIIDGLDLPTPITGDSGFSPSVDDWVDVNYDIEM